MVLINTYLKIKSLSLNKFINIFKAKTIISKLIGSSMILHELLTIKYIFIKVYSNYLYHKLLTFTAVQHKTFKY